MGGRSKRVLRAMTFGIAVVAVLVFMVAALTPMVPRTNWVWSWENTTSAWIAGLLGAGTAAGAVATAVVAWRHRAVRLSRLVALELTLVVATVLAALVLHRSGTWLSDMRAVVPNS